MRKHLDEIFPILVAFCVACPPQIGENRVKFIGILCVVHGVRCTLVLNVERVFVLHRSFYTRRHPSTGFRSIDPVSADALPSREMPGAKLCGPKYDTLVP